MIISEGETACNDTIFCFKAYGHEEVRNTWHLLVRVTSAILHEDPRGITEEECCDFLETIYFKFNSDFDSSDWTFVWAKEASKPGGQNIIVLEVTFKFFESITRKFREFAELNDLLEDDYSGNPTAWGNPGIGRPIQFEYATKTYKNGWLPMNHIAQEEREVDLTFDHTLKGAEIDLN
jgi:hypothetical protein